MTPRSEPSFLRQIIASGSSYALIGGTRVVAAGGLLLFNYAISKQAGVRELGQMSALLSVLIGGAVFGRLGFDLLLMRLVGAAGQAGQGAAAGYVWVGAGAVLTASCLVTALLLASGPDLGASLGIEPSQLRIAVSATPFLASAGMVGACLRASGANALGNLFDVGGFALLAGGLALVDAFTAAAGLANVLTAAALIIGGLALIAMLKRFPPPSIDQMQECAAAICKNLGELE